MPESTTPETTSDTGLPPQLKMYLMELRADPRFLELLRAYPRTRLRTFRVHSGSETGQERRWIYLSGKLEAEQRLLLWLMGVAFAEDEHDRQTDGQ